MSEEEIQNKPKTLEIQSLPIDTTPKIKSTAENASWWSRLTNTTTTQALAKFQNFNPAEESTCIEKLTFLRFSILKTILVILLSPLTIFLLSMYIYWYTSAKKFWFFSEVPRIEEAGFVYIEGKPGNKQIIRIKNETRTLKPLISKELPEELSYLNEGEYRVSA
jgi:hypothetical protein